MSNLFSRHYSAACARSMIAFASAWVRQHAKVRVTGWLMWDEEHASEIEHSRASCWEVHPITKFEVWSAGQWRELSGDFAAN